MMERIVITECMHVQAHARAESLPAWRLSMRGPEANVVGVLGEVVVEHWLKSNNIEFIDERNKTTHDYKLLDGVSTFDVKTKDRTVPLKLDYECTVPLYNHGHQQPNYYIFVSLERNIRVAKDDIRRFHSAYIAGGMNQNQLKAKQRKFSKGDVDPSNNMIIKMDCLNVFARDVSPPDDVIKKWVAMAGSAAALV